MIDISNEVLVVILIALIFISAFFSSSETGMMSINRYRLRHLSRKKSQTAARRVSELLKRPDRLLGVILIGNTFANVLASSVMTLVAVHYLGDIGIIIATVVLTLIILIFAEIAPKTLAALYPERVAFPASLPLKILLKVLYPFVWLGNTIANSLLALFRVNVKDHQFEPLSAEELRTVVNDATGKISSNYQQMLLRILDLEQVTVEDVLVPRNEIYGIDLEKPWDIILKGLTDCRHAYVPLYRESIDKVVGILNLRRVLAEFHKGALEKQDLLKLADKVYFVPEGALLNRQLLNFQEQQKSLGMVVDEYGDIQGLVTMQDILEEIVGEFARRGLDDPSRQIVSQKDGSVIVQGAISVRDLNRIMGWSFPVNGPVTLSGLLIEHVEMIPRSAVCCRIAGYPMELKRVRRNRVELVQIWPQLRVNPH